MTHLSIQTQFDCATPVAAGGDVPELETALSAVRARRRHADVLAIRRAIQARTRRARYFSAKLFGDPAWDMLLELYSASLLEKRLPVSRLAERSGVPMTTALRWISALEREGLVVRAADSVDRRRIFLSLSPKGEAAMESYFIDLEPDVPLL